MAAGDPANLARKVWKVTFNSVYLGLMDAVEPDKLKLIADAISTGSTGAKVVLGRRIIGMEGTIDAVLREVNRANVEALNTHWSSGDSIPLIPAKNTDTYTLAKLLNLHPVEDGATVTQDINILKAYPLIPFAPARAGNGDDMMKISFEAYPDRTSLAADGSIVYGYIGPVPA